jgi:hypothetical protein
MRVKLKFISSEMEMALLFTTCCDGEVQPMWRRETGEAAKQPDRLLCCYMSVVDKLMYYVRYFDLKRYLFVLCRLLQRKYFMSLSTKMRQDVGNNPNNTVYGNLFGRWCRDGVLRLPLQ